MNDDDRTGIDLQIDRLRRGDRTFVADHCVGINAAKPCSGRANLDDDYSPEAVGFLSGTAP
jgi:hypothetical protein